MIGGQLTAPPAPPLVDVEPELPLDVLAWLELLVVTAPVPEWLDEPPVAVPLEPEQAPSAQRAASVMGATKIGRTMKGKVVIGILVSDGAGRLPPGRARVHRTGGGCRACAEFCSVRRTWE
jgi:hypothetical protein